MSLPPIAPSGREGKSNLPPIVQGWREQYAKKKGQPESQFVIGQGERRGISFQFPPSDVDDGLPRVKSGPFKGRVMFSGRREAQEIAKRMADRCETPISYDS